jgi:hypothetical protein
MKSLLAAAWSSASPPSAAKHSLTPATTITTSIHLGTSYTRQPAGKSTRSAPRNVVTAALAFGASPRGLLVPRRRGAEFQSQPPALLAVANCAGAGEGWEPPLVLPCSRRGEMRASVLQELRPSLAVRCSRRFGGLPLPSQAGLPRQRAIVYVFQIDGRDFRVEVDGHEVRFLQD